MGQASLPPQPGRFWPDFLSGRFFGLTRKSPSTAFSNGRGILLLRQFSRCFGCILLIGVCFFLFHKAYRVTISSWTPETMNATVPNVKGLSKLTRPFAAFLSLGCVAPVSIVIYI